MNDEQDVTCYELSAASSIVRHSLLTARSYRTTLAGTVAPHDHESAGGVNEVNDPPAVMLTVPAFWNVTDAALPSPEIAAVFAVQLVVSAT